MNPDSAYLDYRVSWRSGVCRPGKHASRQAGRDGDFRGYRQFWQLPDASRIDVRRSIMDPFGGVVVRQMEQRSAISIVLALDVSRSMAPSPARSHFGPMADLIDAAANSAQRAGDAVGVLAFDENIRADLSVPPSRQPGVLRAVSLGVRRLIPSGTDAAGIEALADHLPHTRCLMIMMSDFLMPEGMIEASLAALSRHDVAPVVMGSHATDGLPRFGVLRLRDAETGARRLVFARPGLARRARDAAQARRALLDRLFAAHGRAAHHAGHSLDLAALSRHLTAI